MFNCIGAGCWCRQKRPYAPPTWRGVDVDGQYVACTDEWTDDGIRSHIRAAMAREAADQRRVFLRDVDRDA